MSSAHIYRVGLYELQKRTRIICRISMICRMRMICRICMIFRIICIIYRSGICVICTSPPGCGLYDLHDLYGLQYIGIIWRFYKSWILHTCFSMFSIQKRAARYICNKPPAAGKEKTWVDSTKATCASDSSSRSSSAAIVSSSSSGSTKRIN